MHRLISLCFVLLVAFCSWGSCKAYGTSHYNRYQSFNSPSQTFNSPAQTAQATIYDDEFRMRHRTEDSLLPFFSHKKGDDWSQVAPSCGGNYQSPIALLERNAVKVGNRQLEFKGIDNVPVSIKLMNDGHSVKYSPSYSSGEEVSLSGGPLTGDYAFHHFHFHWGSTNSRGSEHTLDGTQYASEVHFVHYNKKYGSFDEAAAAPQGLAVIGFFLQVNPDKEYSFLDTGLDKVRNWNDTTTLNDEETYSISDVIGDESFDFISYAGSLTTPPCYETVTWIVSTRVIDLSQEEIDAFRQLIDSEGQPMVDNYRSLQRRNGRKLFLFPDEQY